MAVARDQHRVDLEFAGAVGQLAVRLEDLHDFDPRVAQHGLQRALVDRSVDSDERLDGSR